MAKGNGWEMICGDSIEVLEDREKDTVDYSVFSPPFASLYTYSDDERDMGNCLTIEEFFDHFDFLIPLLLKVTKPGRLLSFHCMNVPSLKERDGVIGLKDFRGKLIAAFEKHGWIFHSEVCIWKDPVTAMQRTKAIGLLYKQLCKDSSLSRQGIADYFVTMRKRGANAEPVAKVNALKLRAARIPVDNLNKIERVRSGEPLTEDELGGFPLETWQKWASPVWMDIDPGDTLQYTHARTEKDERHICPLQLGVIERGIGLWSNAGDLVLSPFAGIGSEGYQAIKMGRRFLGIELKPEYAEWAVKNLQSAELVSKQMMLEQLA